MDEAEREHTTSEMMDLLIENKGHRYVLLGPTEEVRRGRTMIFDACERIWIRISGHSPSDQLHRETVLKMLDRGAKVEPKIPLA
jgi:hypothetical protein